MLSTLPYSHMLGKHATCANAACLVPALDQQDFSPVSKFQDMHRRPQKTCPAVIDNKYANEIVGSVRTGRRFDLALETHIVKCT
jgi:hypothetical protein